MKELLKKIIVLVMIAALFVTVLPENKTEAARKKLSKATVTLSKEKYTFSGKRCKPKVTVEYKGETLVKGTDYTVKYYYNLNPGTAVVVVKGIGKYTGKVKKQFTIVEKSAGGLSIGDESGFLLAGETYKLKVTGTVGTVTYSSSDEKVATVSSKGTVNAKAGGTANIVVKDDKGSKTLKLTVLNYDFVPRELKINPANVHVVEVKNGDRNAEYHWVSDDASIATVDEKGEIRGVIGKGGTTYLRLAVKTLNGTSYTEGVKIEVEAVAAGYEVEKTGSTYKTASGQVTTSFKEGQAAEINLVEGELNKAGNNGESFWHQTGMSTVYLNGYNYYFVNDTWNNRVLVYKVPEKTTWGYSDHTVTKYLYCILGQTDITGAKAGYSLSGLNWPISSTAAVVNGKIKVFVTDTNNNRILVWDNLLDIENKSSAIYGKKYGPAASYSIAEKCDVRSLNYNDATTKAAGFVNDAESNIKWPWDIWTDGTRLICTSTQEGVLLIWEQLPEKSDKYPDKVIRTGGTIRTIACNGNYLVLGDHNIETKEGNNISGAKIIEDYNSLKYTAIKDKSGSKTLFEYTNVVNGTKGFEYCEFEGHPSGLFLTEPLATDDGKTLPKGTLLLTTQGCIWVYPDGKVSAAKKDPAYYVGGGAFEETRLYRFVGGDLASIIVDHNGNFYFSSGGRGNIDGYKAGTFPSEPAGMTAAEIKKQDGDVFVYNGAYYEHRRSDGVLEKHCDEFPNVWIGSEDALTNAYKATYRYQNCMVVTDGKHLAAASDCGGMGSALLLWKNIPDDSLAKPDVIYYFDVKDNMDDAAVYDNGKTTMLMAGGLNAIYIWNDIETALEGGEPDISLRSMIGNVEVRDIKSFAYDGEYFYFSDSEAVYIFKGIPETHQAPVAKLAYREAKIHVTTCDDGETYIALSQIGNPVIYKRSEALKNGQKMELKGAVTDFAGGYEGNTFSGKKLADSRCCFNGVSDVLITKGGQVILADISFYRVIIWDSIAEAVKEGETGIASKTRIVLGYGKDYYDYCDVLAADSSNYCHGTVPDLMSAETASTLFRPNSLAYDGRYLWIADFKFSGGIKRFSGRF